MFALHTATTAEMPESLLADLQELCELAFDGSFAASDWEHALGGLHVWVTENGRAVSHGALVERRLVCSGQAWRTGYVEAVATAAEFRGRGYGTLVMQRISEAILTAWPLGALSTGEHAFYERLGWERWCGPTFAETERTPDDDDSVMVLRTPRSLSLNLEGDIRCDWRSGDVW